MRLKYQLFLTLLLLCIILIALMAAFASWSFDRGFSQYVVDEERSRLVGFTELLAERYQDSGSWDWIQSEPDLRELLRQSDHFPGRAGSPGKESRRKDRDKPSGPRGRSQRPIPLLVDMDREPLLNQRVPTKNVAWVPINSGNEVIGYLGIRKPRGAPGELADVFIRQQLKNYAFAAAAMIFLSALAAVLLASRIVKPILSVNDTVEKITGGDFEPTVPLNRGDEIGGLSRNISYLASTLKSNQDARQQWMAEISHELRTPVAVLRGELESIQDGVTQANEGSINSLHAETLRLGGLIDDLHELSMVDLGAMEYRMAPLDLKELVESRIDAGSSLLSQARLSVSISAPTSPVMVLGDPKRLSQLIDNLLQNSLRYTDANGSVNVALERESDSVQITWSDSTPGVSDTQLPHLFDPLFRAETSRSRNTGGSGLGLSIVQKIAQAHGATIEAFHAKEGGLGIRIRLSASVR